LDGRRQVNSLFVRRRRRFAVEDVIAFFAAPFPADQREYARSMRVVAEHLVAAGVAGGLVPVPFNCFGFGLFAPGGRPGPADPYIGVWFDTTDPVYWVQIRAPQEVDGELLACEQCFGVEEAAAIVREFTPRLLALSTGAGGDAEPDGAPDTGRDID
jgi:hypothetical protein